MEHINGQEPEAVLRLSELDTELVQALAKHWLVIVEQRDNGIVLTLHTMTDERNINDSSFTDNRAGRMGSD